MGVDVAGPDAFCHAGTGTARAAPYTTAARTRALLWRFSLRGIWHLLCDTRLWGRHICLSGIRFDLTSTLYNILSSRYIDLVIIIWLHISRHFQ